MKTAFAFAVSLLVVSSVVSFDLYASDVTDLALVISTTPVIEKVSEVTSDCARDTTAPARTSQADAAACAPVESTHDVVTSYKVVYRYNGLDATTVFPYNPGDFITVGVAAIPDVPR